MFSQKWWIVLEEGVNHPKVSSEGGNGGLPLTTNHWCDELAFVGFAR